jgi:hypothetical protein
VRRPDSISDSNASFEDAEFITAGNLLDRATLAGVDRVEGSPRHGTGNASALGARKGR